MILAAFLPSDRRDDVLADLDEEYTMLVASSGIAVARRWYVAQVFKSIGPIFGHWLRTTGIGAPSARTIFFALGILWFTGVAWAIPIGDNAQNAALEETRPGAVTMGNGMARPVYWLEDSGGFALLETPGLIRFAILLFVPPIVVASGLAFALSAFGGRNRSPDFPFVIRAQGRK